MASFNLLECSQYHPFVITQGYGVILGRTCPRNIGVARNGTKNYGQSQIFGARKIELKCKQKNGHKILAFKKSFQ